MNTRTRARRYTETDADLDCAVAWDRLESAAARLEQLGGPTIGAAIDAFYDAWTDRLAVTMAGEADGESLRRLEAELARLESAAETPEARQAVQAFVQVAMVEVEAAMARLVVADAAVAIWDADSGMHRGHA